MPKIPRPRWSNSEIGEELVNMLMPEVEQWSRWHKVRSPERFKKDLKRVVEGNNRDGYALAQCLDMLGTCKPDAELVQILDSAKDFAIDINVAHVTQWVAQNGIEPDLEVGAIVRTRYGTGPIMGIIAETAQYIVQTDEYLRQSPSQAGKAAGYILAFEDVSQMEAALS